MKNNFVLKRLSDIKNLEKWFETQIKERKDKSKFEKFVVSFMNLTKYKTLKQNNTFWSLLECFGLSHCSSFHSYSEMVEYYYRIAGLITIKTKTSLQQSTKLKLYKLIEANSFFDWEKEAIYKLLKGEYEKHLSWSRVGKKKAILAIDSLLHDMDESNVIGSKMGKKYEEILIGMDAL